MNKPSHLYSLSQSAKKQIMTSPLVSLDNNRNLLKETQNNFSSLMSNLQSKTTPTKTTLINTSKEKGMVPYIPTIQLIHKEGRSSHTNKPSPVISELTNRLINLELKLNQYQTKANQVKDSLQKTLSPLKNKVIQSINKPKQSHTTTAAALNEDNHNNNSYNEVIYNGRNYDRREANEQSLSLLKGKSKNHTVNEANDDVKVITTINEPTITITTINNNNDNNNKFLSSQLSELLTQIRSLKVVNNKTKDDIIKIKSDYQLALSTTHTQLLERFSREKENYIKLSSSESLKLKEEISKVNEDLKQTSQQKEAMQKDLFALTITNKDLKLSLTKSNLQCDQYSTEINTKLTPQLASLLRKNKDLETVLQSTKDQYERNYLTQKTQIQQLETEMLKQKEEVNSIGKDYQNNKKDLDHYIEMNDRLSKEIEVKTNKYIKDKSQSSVLTQQIKTKDKTIAELTSSNSALKESIKENELRFKKELGIITKEFKDYKAAYDVPKKMHVSELENQPKQRTKTEEEALYKSVELEKEIRRLNDIISDYKNESDEYVNEKILLNEEIAITKQEIQRDRIKAQEINAKHMLTKEEDKTTIRELRSLIEEMKRNAEEIKEEGEKETTQKAIELNRRNEIEKEKYESKMKELNETINHLNEDAEISKSKQSLLSSELASALKKITENDSNAQIKLNSLESNLIKAQEDINSHKESNGLLLEENRKCNAIITMQQSKLEEDSLELQSLELAISKLSTENKALLNEINNNKTQINQLNETAELKANDLLTKMKDIEKRNILLIDSSHIKDKEIAQLNQMNEEYKSKIESLTTIIAQLNQSKENLQEEHNKRIDDIEADLNTKDNTIRNKQTEIDDLFNTVVDYKEQLDSLIKDNNMLRNGHNNDNEINIIHKSMNILLDESASNTERTRVKDFLLDQIRNQYHHNQLIITYKEETNNDHEKDEDEDDGENEEDIDDNDDFNDDICELDDDDKEEINIIPGQRNSTLKKKGFSSSLLSK